ncbi:hypothetical protein Acr_05g0002010 [Actinidia rufa]|uniref:Uncharacterized protein n=1 Tax=Actinidia rufa TaxID=165716 RepID=A0A7J0EJV2_9ERIC|nr:hypothetical protein Acr_05g0002010 [Actinidia rufa]
MLGEAVQKKFIQLGGGGGEETSEHLKGCPSSEPTHGGYPTKGPVSCMVSLAGEDQNIRTFNEIRHYGFPK